MKPKLLFVDHSFHKKTRATFFLRDILKRDFKIVNLWDDSWKGEGHISVERINDLDCDYVLFFQVLPYIAELKQIKHKVIWVPMYDPCFLYGNSFWLELSSLPIKIISFSKTLSTKMIKTGLDVLDVKFYFDPKLFIKKYPSHKNVTGLSVFFWQRGSIKFEKVKKVLGNIKINQLIIKNDPDPGFHSLKLSRKDVLNYNVKVVSGHFSKEKYLQLVEDCDVFVCPRSLEGIGMSFLEPMAMGKVVLALNHPTMNEYIKHKENGFLYSPLFTKNVKLAFLDRIGKQARISTEYGYKIWVKQSKKIPIFIRGDYQVRQISKVKLSLSKLVDVPYIFFKKIYIEFVNRF
jgi:glycosyltransferase involved in cell wall biosynthesis